jgi:hypothetical protein
MLGTSARRVRWTLKVASPRGGLHPLGSTDSILRTHSGDQNSQSPHLSEDIGLAPVGHDAKAPADSGGGDHRQSIESVEKPDFAPAWKVAVIMVGLGLAVLCMALVSFYRLHCIMSSASINYQTRLRLRLTWPLAACRTTQS